MKGIKSENILKLICDVCRTQNSPCKNLCDFASRAKKEISKQSIEIIEVKNNG